MEDKCELEQGKYITYCAVINNSTPNTLVSQSLAHVITDKRYVGYEYSCHPRVSKHVFRLCKSGSASILYCGLKLNRTVHYTVDWHKQENLENTVTCINKLSCASTKCKIS